MMRIWVVAWGLFLAFGPVAASTRWALLVGVNEYPTLPSQLQLKGPRNDVQNIKQALIERGFIEARSPYLSELTGKPGEADAPTRANILAALAKLERAAKRGDFIFIYFAGHGSQQPATGVYRKQEPDGLSEIFLPQDVGRWNPRARPKAGVTNAILDYELSESIQKMRFRGAFTWAVFDACNSSTLASSLNQVKRGADDLTVTLRAVRPEDLGIPLSALQAGRLEGQAQRGVIAEKPLFLDESRRQSGEAPGAFFYSAQTTEHSVEKVLSDDRNTKKVFGVYSYVLTKTLRSGFEGSYVALSEKIRLGMTDPAMQPVYSTPCADGNGLLLEVLNPVQKWTDPWPREWPAFRERGEKAIRIQAGALHGLRVGQNLRLRNPTENEHTEFLVRVSALGAKSGLAMPTGSSPNIWESFKEGERWLVSIPGTKTDGPGLSQQTRKRAASLWHLATAIARKSPLKGMDIRFDSVPLASAMNVAEGEAMMTLRNLSPYPIDVTVLFIDEHAGISVLFPTPGQQSRIEGLSALSIDQRIPLKWTAQNRQQEHLIVLMAPSMKDDGPFDMTFWAQKGLTKAYAKQEDQNSERKSQFDSLWTSSGGVGNDVQAAVVSVKVQTESKKRMKPH